MKIAVAETNLQCFLFMVNLYPQKSPHQLQRESHSYSILFIRLCVWAQAVCCSWVWRWFSFSSLNLFKTMVCTGSERDKRRVEILGPLFFCSDTHSAGSKCWWSSWGSKAVLIQHSCICVLRHTLCQSSSKRLLSLIGLSDLGLV